jgi:leucyl/phenylalanyl-tRNA---protein transferase
MDIPFDPLTVEWAYRQGVFPMWVEEYGEICWYRPDPRTIMPLDGFHISRSLSKTIRQGKFTVMFNTDFEGVMRGCADREEGSWINESFIEVYGALHRQGKGHCVAVYLGDRLVGGTYGLAFGGAFMAESMFHYETDASKVALAALVSHLNAQGFALLDVQYLTPHLASLGAIEISDRQYQRRLRQALRLNCRF